MSATSLPDKIKIGDNEYSLKDTPEILSVLEIVRTQEKNKLYSNIKSLEAKLTEAESKITTTATDAATKAAEVKKLNDALAVMKADFDKNAEELKAIKGKKGGDDDDDDNSGKKSKKSGLTEADVIKAVEAALEKQESKFKELLKGNEEKLSKKVVEDHRDKLLQNNKGLLIPDLLTGNTVEELNTNLVKALETSKDYITVELDGKKVTLREQEELTKKKASQKGSGEGDDDGQGGGLPPKFPARPGAGQEPPSGETLLKNVKDMSPEEYAKHRGTLMQEAKKIKY